LVKSGRGADRDWFMSIPRCYTYDDGSLFVSEHHSSTLLNVCNLVPILPKVTNIGLQILVTCAFYIFVTFNQYN
jgi:hypothetical protein